MSSRAAPSCATTLLRSIGKGHDNELFVLMAGVAGVRPLKFVTAIAAARGLRYLALGALAIRYGDFALELMRTQGRTIAIWIAGLVVAAAVAWWLVSRWRK